MSDLVGNPEKRFSRVAAQISLSIATNTMSRDTRRMSSGFPTRSYTTRLYNLRDTALFGLIRNTQVVFYHGRLYILNKKQERMFTLISSPEPKAHWSAYRIPMVRRSSTFSNIFFSKKAWPIKAKLYVEPPWVGETKVCSRHLGHMTKMAAMPIYGKNPPKIFFSRTGGPIFTKLGM